MDSNSCFILIYQSFICIFCAKKGVTAPVNLNFLSIGTGALLGLPGIVILYATAVLLFR